MTTEKPRGLRLTDRQWTKAKKMLAEGASKSAVAKAFGVSRQAVYQRIGRADGKNRYRPPASVSPGDGPMADRWWSALLRQERDKTKRPRLDVALEAGVDGGALFNWEKGKHIPTLELFEAVLNVYGYTLIAVPIIHIRRAAP